MPFGVIDVLFWLELLYRELVDWPNCAVLLVVACLVDGLEVAPTEPIVAFQDLVLLG